MLTFYHGCCDTFYIFAYCGLVGNPHSTAKKLSFCSPFHRHFAGRSLAQCRIAQRRRRRGSVLRARRLAGKRKPDEVSRAQNRGPRRGHCSGSMFCRILGFCCGSREKGAILVWFKLIWDLYGGSEACLKKPVQPC